MADTRKVVEVAREGEIAVVTLDSPPVNALSHTLRTQALDAVRAADGDAGVKAIVMIGAGRGFSGGADITEFGKPPQAPSLHDLIDVIENAGKPVIAALHGSTLGGGLRDGAGLPLPRRRALRESRPAGGEARPAARRRRHAAPAPARRGRQAALEA